VVSTQIKTRNETVFFFFFFFLGKMLAFAWLACLPALSRNRRGAELFSS
jgi:hypothetical protein